MQFIPKSLLMRAVIAFAVSSNSFSQGNNLQGCWKSESVTGLQFNGVSKTWSADCFDFFDASTVTNTCVSKIGVVQPSRTDQYQVASQGKLLVSPGKYEKSPREYEYRVDGDQLTRIQDVDSTQVKKPETLIKRTIVAHRLAATSADTCLPKPVVVSKEDAAKYWQIEKLVGQTIENTMFFYALLGFTEGYRQPFPLDSVSEKNQAKVLSELHRITDESSVSIRQALTGLGPRTLEIFYRTGHCNPSYIDQTLAAPLKQAWVADSVKEISGSQRLDSYLMFFRVVAPDKMVTLLKADEKDLLDKRVGLGSNYQMQRELLLRFAASPWMKSVLPEGPQLSALSELSRKNAEIAKANYFSPPNCLEREVHFTAQELVSNDLKDLIITESSRAKAQSVQLRTRFEYAIDSQLSDMCVKYGNLYEPESIKDSRGDWQKVKIYGGKALTPGAREMSMLPAVYASGCFGKRDVAAARRTLEVFANAHGDKGKLAASTHCQLARWYRYGIGGKRDETRAKYWEDRFQSETGATGGCFKDPRPVIDPDDPWRITN